MGKIAGRKIKDDYFELVKVFPLKTIRNEQQFDEATWMLAKLLGRVKPLSQGENDYADALTSLIREYDRLHTSPSPPKMTGIELVRNLLADFELSQKQFAQILGISEPVASMILTGKRDLTKSHIAKLSAYFELPPSAFF